MNREELLGQILQAVYDTETIVLYDHVANTWPANPEAFGYSKLLGDRLVEEKLARYTDQQHTVLSISNFGRYWIMKGGYSEFLKSGERKIKSHDEGNGHHQDNDVHSFEDHHHSKTEKKLKEDLAEARLKFTRFRLVTFWWSFSVSLIGFFLSLLSLYLVLKK